MGPGEAERRQAQQPLSAPHKQVLPPACAAGAEARPAGRARLSALHRGSRLGGSCWVFLAQVFENESERLAGALFVPK